jgi:prepilin-type N-terminal cleavage/methylation domain-containing protein
MQSKRAFTLVELMIVVVIVAILALVAIPLYTGNITAAKWSEGVSGVGALRTALRVYAASHNGNLSTDFNVSSAASLPSAAGFSPTDLNGKYFTSGSYAISGCSASNGNYTITATLTSGQTYIINQDGSESGTYKTGM